MKSFDRRTITRRPSTWLGPDKLWLWLLGAGLLLYLFYLPLSYVGSFNDDATYVLMARSLLQGKYVALFQWGQPPFTLYPPGFPLFLAPFVWGVEPHWDLLEVLSIALTLLNGWMAWSLYRSWLPPKPRWMALGIFVLNPVTASLSCAVVSEPLLVTCTLSGFLLLRRVLSSNTRWEPWVLGLVIGVAPLIRIIGVALIPAVIVGLLYARRRRMALQVFLTASLVGGLFSLRNYLLANKVTAYSMYWHSSLSDMSQPLLFLDNLNRITNAIFVNMLLAIRLPYNAWGIVWSTVLTGLVFLVIAAGLRSWKTFALPSRVLLLTAGVYSLLWYGVHALWRSIELRFAFPILPFVGAFFVVGCYRIYQQQRSPIQHGVRKAALAFAVLYLCVNGVDLARAWNKKDQPERRPPRTTWAWIQEHLPAQAYILHPKTAEVYLYTGRLADGPLFNNDEEDFRYNAMRKGITHVWVRPIRFKMMQMSLNIDRAWVLNQEWTIFWPDAFTLIYRNPLEATLLYEVKTDPSYIQAYELYLKAHQDLANSSTEEGLKKLDHALRHYPRLTSALNAYGATCILSGKHLKLAETRLKDAVRFRPENALAYYNLAGLYRLTGRRKLAQESLEKAAEIIRQVGQFDDLRPLIEGALKTL